MSQDIDKRPSGMANFNEDCCNFALAVARRAGADLADAAVAVAIDVREGAPGQRD